MLLPTKVRLILEAYGTLQGMWLVFHTGIKI